MATLSETVDQLKKAIDSERTDIICTIISTWQKSTSDADLLQHVLNEPQTDCGTLLHYATKLGKSDIVRALLVNGADPGVQNSDGNLPVDLASDEIRSVYNEELLQSSAQSNLGRVCQLLAAGVDVNLEDSKEMKNTPLHWAVSYGSQDMVQCLCSRGATVNHVNAVGHSPLHDAIRRGDERIIEELLLAGADPKQLITHGPDAGKSVIDLAVDREDLQRLLKSPPKKRTLMVEGTQLGLRSHIDSKRNLVRFDSSASYESTFTDTNVPNGIIANGVDPSIPQLMSPAFKKPPMFEDINVPPLKPVITEERLNLLWPQPQSIVQGGGKPFVIKNNLTVLVAGGPNCNPSEIISQWNVKKTCFESVGVELSIDIMTSLNMCDTSHVLCHVNSRLCPGKGTYKLTITPKQLKIVCGSLESLNYALATVLQLFTLYKTEDEIRIPTLLIDDWPELSYRGILLDISQGRVPNVTTLKDLLSALASLKVNQIYMYSRFRSKQPPEWQLCYSRGELLDLDAFCHIRGLQLIPVLEVAPKVHFEDLPQLYTSFQDYVSCFSHTEFVSAGPRLSSFILDATDENLNVNDASKFLPISRDQTIQLCGYPLHDLSTSLLQQLPPHLVFKEYGVKADHNFNSFCTPLADLGIHFFVCPGTAAWNSLAGCPEAAVSNIFNAIKCANSHGGLGLVACNWTGKGHLTNLPFCWPGFLMAAGLSWNSDTHWDFLLANMADLLNQHVYHDREHVIGQAIVELGRAETYLIRCAHNQAGDDCQNLPDEHGSILFRFLTYPDSVPLEHLTPDVIQRAIRHVKKCQAVLSKSAVSCDQATEILEELHLTCDFMLFAAKIGRVLVLSGRKPNNREAGFDVVNFGIANLTPTTKTDLANRLLELLEVYVTVWNKRYLPHQGQQDSLSTLHSLLRQLIPDKTPEDLKNLTLDVKL